MKAIVYDRYGSPAVLRLAEVEQPRPKDDEILIKIWATGVNRSDWESLTGSPAYARLGGLFKPHHKILGSDIAGQVVMAGKMHQDFKEGDEVFGDILGHMGGFAEYVCVRGNAIALKPASLSFEQAAAIPQPAVIAWQGIYTQGKVQAGQKVLINGAGGGAGTFAIQLARLAGADVTGVDSADKLDFMRLLGAEHVIDYTREDFTMDGRQYDLILDMVAQRPVFAYQRALKPGGTCFLVGGAVSILLGAMLGGARLRRSTGKNVRVLAVQPNRKDLVTLGEMCATGKILPAIDRVYPLSEVPDALQYLGEGWVRGRVVIKIIS